MRLAQAAQYLDDVPHGESLAYVNGVLRSRRSFRLGKLHGLMTVYDEAGQKVAEYPYVDGEISGEARVYTPDGKVAQRLAYKAGKPSGEWLEFYASGALLTKTPYVNGRRHGERLGFHENGQIRERAEYNQGKPAGPVREYDAKGRLAKVDGKKPKGPLADLFGG